MVQRGDPSRDTPSPVTIHGLRAWDILRSELGKRGIAFKAIAYARIEEVSSSAVLLWDFGSISDIPRKLRERLLISWSLESPLVAHRAFHRLEEIASVSRATLTFRGARTLVRDPERITPVNYPITPREPVEDDWTQREHLVMIASNKRLRPSLSTIEVRRPYKSMRVLASTVLAQSYRVRGQWTLPDLYEDRAKAIEFFSEAGGFRLYGSGWESSSSVRGSREVYGGRVADKHETLSRFRFSLCFENTRFPGYITEKIFDCFFAGTIPVYFGAPDIYESVPQSAFVDASAFEDLGALRDHLEGMTSDDAKAYREAAASFLASSRFRPFDERSFVESMIREIESASRS